MTKALMPKKIWLAAALAVVAVGLGCSTKSPTAPQQTPAPPPGTQVSATWVISIDVAQRELTVGTTESSTITVRVKRLDDNQPPPNGTTMVLFTTLGEFLAPGSGAQSVVLTTFNGRAEAQLFPGDVAGNALLTAQLEASAGQTSVKVVDAIEPVVAAFEFQNSDDDLSIQFQDTSTGNPTKWRWDFGDGKNSRERNPSHLYPVEGDYVVTLTVSKTGSQNTVSRIVSVSEDPEFIVEASFDFLVDNRTVVFQDTSTGNPTSWRWDFGDGSGSSAQNPIHEYSSAGAYVVTLTARNSRTEATTSQIISVEEGVFITDVSPNAGPAAGGDVVTISGQGFAAPLRVLLGGLLAQVTSSSPNRIVITTPPGVLVTEECDDNGNSINGIRTFDTAVDVVVELASGATNTAPGGYTYLSPTGSTCVGD